MWRFVQGIPRGVGQLKNNYSQFSCFTGVNFTGPAPRFQGLLPYAGFQNTFAVVKSRDIPICKLLAKCREMISLVDFL